MLQELGLKNNLNKVEGIIKNYFRRQSVGEIFWSILS